MHVLPWQRSTVFRTVLPTKLPGVRLAAEGRIWFRYGGKNCTLTSASAARAAALAEAYGMAVERTSLCSPADVFTTEQRLAQEFATWRRARHHPGLRIKGRITLALTKESTRRVALYEEKLLTAHLEQKLAGDRLDHLANAAFADMRRARLWWFDQHLSQGELPESWEAFDAIIRPLIHDNKEDAATRFAEVVATAVQRALDEPDKAELIRLAAHVLLTTAKWHDLAATLNTNTAIQPANGKSNGSEETRPLS